MFLELTASNYKNHNLAQFGVYARQRNRNNQKFISDFINNVNTVKFTGVFGFNNDDNTDLLNLFKLISYYTTYNRVFGKPVTTNMFTKNLLSELNGKDADKPTSVSMHFMLDNSILEYTLIVHNSKVISETLAQDSFTCQSGIPKQLLSRQLTDDGSYKVTVNSDDGEQQFIVPANNATESIISAYAKDHPAAKLIFDYMKDKVTTNLDSNRDKVLAACMVFTNDTAALNEAQDILRAFDFLPTNSEIVINYDGVVDYNIEIHYKNERLGDKTVVFTFDEQSSGFQQMFCLLSKIVPVLKNGGLCVIDYIDDHLHCLVAEALISLFDSKKCHAQAQCLATLQTTYLLKKLNHDQVFFVDTNENRPSVKSAESFFLRRDADLEEMLYKNLLIKLPSLKLE